uniref:VWFC domain-containing protein n=1 Tax=Salmo trutta TaxID=8032 RepID=A0A674BQT4_SALTR
MRSLAVAVILCALLPLFHAGCWFKPAEPGMRQCLYDKDGTWHDIGSRWRTSDCMNCYCQANGDMSCSFPDCTTTLVHITLSLPSLYHHTGPYNPQPSQSVPPHWSI